jgi:methyl-accepting chemotaxis protein
MLKQRRHAAEQVAESLFAAEAAIDAALACTAKLAGQMPSVRQDARLSALIGQGAIEQAIEAMSALSQARRSICATHKELSMAQGHIGLGAARLDGTGSPKPPSDAEMLPMARQLRPVDARKRAA